VSTYRGPFRGDAPSINEAHAIALTGENAYVAGFSTDSVCNSAMCIILYDPDGVQLWVENYPDSGSGGGDAKAYAITVDAAGEDAVVTGYSTGLAGPVITTIKYDKTTGQRLWVKKFSDSTFIESKAYAISVDGAGNIIVSGYAKDTTNKTSLIVIKYEPDSGNTVWVKKYDTGFINVGKAMCVDKTDNSIIITGYTAVNNVTGNEDYLTIKYDSSGNMSMSWPNIYNGPGNGTDVSQAVILDDSSNVYVTGYSQGVESGLDYCTIKYSSSGDSLWSVRYNGTGNSDDIANKMVLASGNNVIVTGSSRSGSEPGTEDYVTINYNALSGDSIWVKRCNGTGNNSDIAYSLAYSPANNAVYVTGTCQSGVPESTEDMVTIAYSVDTTAAVIDSLAYNGTANNQDVAYDIKVDSLSNVYITGFTVGSGGDRSHFGSSIATMKYASKRTVHKNITPSIYKLYQNYPNPFNPTTTIKFDIGKAANVKIVVYDLLGREVGMPVNSFYMPGTYEIKYNMLNLASGIYFYQLSAASYRDVKKMILLK
jgi:hypothetical protein